MGRYGPDLGLALRLDSRLRDSIAAPAPQAGGGERGLRSRSPRTSSYQCPWPPMTTWKPWLLPLPTWGSSHLRISQRSVYSSLSQPPQRNTRLPDCMLPAIQAERGERRGAALDDPEAGADNRDRHGGGGTRSDRRALAQAQDRGRLPGPELRSLRKKFAITGTAGCRGATNRPKRSAK